MGINSRSGAVSKASVTVSDVGGQAQERQYWHDHAKGSNGVLYVSSLADFNLKDAETGGNRLLTQLELFEQVCSSKEFSDKAVVLLLNKFDLFLQKLMVHQLQDYFPDYDGPNDVQSASTFLKGLFESKLKGQAFLALETTATDTTLMQSVLSGMTKAIMKNNFK